MINRNLIKNEYIYLYNENGKIPKTEIKDNLQQCWEPIYKQHENHIITNFQQESREAYRHEHERPQRTYALDVSAIDISTGNLILNHTRREIPPGIA